MADTNDIKVLSYLDLERDPVNTYHAATKSYVDAKYDILNAGKAATSHTHSAADITSGTVGAARLPLATVSVRGAVIVGSGLSIVESGDQAGQLQAKIKNGGGLLVGTDGLYISTSFLNTQIIGTTAGKAPALGSDGKLPLDVLPQLNITEVVSVTDAAALTSLTTAQVQKGDLAITDAGEAYILAGSNPATASHWKQINNPAAGVTGIKLGSSTTVLTGTVTVTAASLGLVTSSGLAASVATASEAKFPSEKALWTFVTQQITNLGLGQAATKDTVTSYSLAGLEEEEGLVEGAGLLLVIDDFLDTYRMAYGTNGSGIVTTNDTKLVTAKAAKKIADDAAASATAAAAKGKIFSIVGNGTSKEFTCTHGLGIANFLVQVYTAAGALVMVATEKTATSVTFKFSEAPATGTSYTAVILGVQEAS